ncbi:Glutamine synthetase, partial [Dissostichus eleginoides]
ALRYDRKFAVGSESGPSFYLFPEVRKSLCIFRSQLSTVEIFKAWNGSGKSRPPWDFPEFRDLGSVRVPRNQLSCSSCETA